MKNKDYLNQLINRQEDVPVVEINNNNYRNNLFKIEFEIPPKWHILSMAKYREEGLKQIVNESFESIKSDILDFLGPPSLVLTKYDVDSEEHDGIVTPTISLNIIPKENHLEDVTLQEYAEYLSEGDGDGEERMVKEFSITNKGNIYYKDGYEFIQYDTRYLFEYSKLTDGIMVELAFLYTDYNDFFLEFGMTGCKAQGNSEKHTFDRFINSIKLG